ncbi:MAG: methyltransferase domain-containing protein [Candidatus Aminicenantes bacterium]|nr:methyltransferase domain-containing protein [Candidatus Aminicenantes bacterium]
MKFPTLPALIVILGLLALAAWIAWRLVSRRRALPCPSWLSWLVDNPAVRRRTLATLERLKLAPGMSVLDAGCGPGRLAVPIARAVGPQGRVLAVDLQPRMLERAKGKAAVAGAGNVEFMLAGLGQGKVPAGRFDRALLSWVLGEIPDRVSALREIHAALRPGGFLLVSEVLPDPHYQSLAKVKALAQESGFRVGAYYGSRFEYAIALEKPADG